MRVSTLWWIAAFGLMFAFGMLLFGRALDHQLRQQSSYCDPSGPFADSSLCK